MKYNLCPRCGAEWTHITVSSYRDCVSFCGMKLGTIGQLHLSVGSYNIYWYNEEKFSTVWNDGFGVGGK